MKTSLVRLGVAGALTALSLAAVAVPAQATASNGLCGPVIDSVKICTAPDGSSYPVMVNGSVSGPVPGIGGALMVGNTLTVFDGTWNPSDARLTHQWLRNDVPVLGATGTTYKLTSNDVGKGIRVTTTATVAGYQSATVRSASTGPVINVGGTVPRVQAPSTVTTGWGGTNEDEPSDDLAAQPGMWPTPGVQFHYQWLWNGEPIPGATSRVYARSEADAGKRLSVRITGYAPGFDPVSVTSAEQMQYTLNPIPGAVVTGGTAVGEVLTGTDDVPWHDFNGRGETNYPHTYQWLRSGVPIPGSTALTYTIAAEDQGKTLVLMTLTDSYDAYSNSTSVPASASLKQLTNTAKPALSGTSTTDVALTVTAGTWSLPADKVTITYAWMSSDGRMLGDGTTFTPGQNLVGKTISVVVTATAPGYTTERVTITAEKPVTAPDPTQTEAPALAANPVVGVALTVTPGAWSDRDAQVKRSFQWRRDGKSISGATGATYTPVKADFGKKLSVKIISTLDGRVLKTDRVTAPVKVAAGALKTAEPTISGTAKAGKVLTAKPGSWTKGTHFKYRWLRDGKPISNAYSSKYKVRKADKDAKITVRITGNLRGYTTASRESAAFIAR